MENQNPNQSDDRVAAEAEAYAEQQPQKLEITIREAEVMKIAPEPGDVLFFKFKGDHFYTEDVNKLGKELRALFPANKVVVMALPDNHDVELTMVANQDKVVEKDCSKPTSYCADCSCGKKERIEGSEDESGQTDPGSTD
jgi:hypothetical protein